MNIATLLIINNVALVVAIALIILFLVAWLRAEYKVYKLGGKTKWFRTPKKNGRK